MSGLRMQGVLVDNPVRGVYRRPVGAYCDGVATVVPSAKSIQVIAVRDADVARSQSIREMDGNAGSSAQLVAQQQVAPCDPPVDAGAKAFRFALGN